MSKEIKEYNVILNNEQVKALVDELKEKDKKIKKIEILVECLFNNIPLNKEQEKLLDHILFGSDKE